MSVTTRERWYRGISAGLALGAHGLLIGGGLLWQPVQEVATNTAISVVMVELNMLPPSLPPAESSPSPPQQPARTQHDTSRPIPPPDVALEPAVFEHTLASMPEPLPPQAPQNTSQTTPPQVDTAPASQSATQPTASAASQQAITSWQQQLLAHLQHYRRYPGQARRLRQQGVAHVRFSVDRQGRVSQPRIEHPSGYPLLDEETLATVHRASPVPPPPVDMPGNPVDVVMPVSFHLRRR